MKKTLPKNASRAKLCKSVSKKTKPAVKRRANYFKESVKIRVNPWLLFAEILISGEI
jgi:hypothetical protein